jgi:Ax21 family sulfation-dependent quorum factor
MKKSLIAFALLAALPMAAFAGDTDLNYTYVQGGYVNLDAQADGAYLRGSANLGQSNFYLFGEAARVEVRHTDFDVNLGEVGAGYHHALGARTDLLGELAYNRVHTDFGNSDGYRASAGVRHAFAPRFNGLAKVNYRDQENLDGDFSLTLGGEYKFNDRWSVAAEAEAGERHSEQYRVGVRYNF